eukprot:UN17854
MVVKLLPPTHAVSGSMLDTATKFRFMKICVGQVKTARTVSQKVLRMME